MMDRKKVSSHCHQVPCFLQCNLLRCQHTYTIYKGIQIYEANTEINARNISFSRHMSEETRDRDFLGYFMIPAARSQTHLNENLMEEGKRGYNCSYP